MQKILILLFLLYATTPMHAENNIKQEALSATAHFFNIKKQNLVLEGHFIETNPEYGKRCKVYIDFSQTGEESLTLVGEYSPAGTIGDGIYFNENASTFESFEFSDNTLSLEQKMADNFSTGMNTKVLLKKNAESLEFYLYQQKRFFFFTQVIEKKCIVEIDINPQK